MDEADLIRTSIRPGIPVRAVHAVEHGCPVIGLGSAVPGLDRDEAIAVIVLAAEQRLEFDLLPCG